MHADDSVPSFPGSGLLGHAVEFRKQRVDLMLRAARAYPDICRIRLGIIPVTLLSSPAMVHEMLVDKPEQFRKSYGLSVFAEPILGDGLLRLEGQAHRKRRRMVAPAFLPRRIAGYAGEMIRRADSAAERMQQHGRIDIAEETMRVTMEIVGKTLFDAEVADDADDVGDAVSEAMTCMLDSMTSVIPMPPAIPTRTNLRLRRAVARLDQVVYRMIAERRAEPERDHGDLLSILISTRDEEDRSALTDREIRDEAMTLFLAGHETTANTLAWALYLLARNPAARARVEHEVDAIGPGSLGAADVARLPYTLQVIKEAMRIYPPVYMLGRQPLHDLKLGRYGLRRNSIVVINVIGMHRRPDIFPDPERFDPDRFSPEREKLLPRQAFMPFGGGPRICIGNHFALMEAQLILASWLRRLRFELADPSAEPRLEPLITLRPLGGIAMQVTSRAPARAVEARAAVE